MKCVFCKKSVKKSDPCENDESSSTSKDKDLFHQQLVLYLDHSNDPNDGTTAETIWKNLFETTGGPSDGIQFCGGCSSLMEKGKELLGRINQLQKRLGGIRHKIFTTVEASSNEEDGGRTCFPNLVRQAIIKAQDSVGGNNFEEQFITGDAEADFDLNNVKTEMESDSEMDLNEYFNFGNVVYPDKEDDEDSDRDEQQSYCSSSSSYLEVSPAVKKVKGMKSKSLTNLKGSTCPICIRVFTTSALMKKHLKTHSKTVASSSIKKKKTRTTRTKTKTCKTADLPSIRRKKIVSTPAKTPKATASPSVRKRKKRTSLSKTPENLRTCPLCSVVFEHPSKLVTHLQRSPTTHKDLDLTNVEIQCPICPFKDTDSVASFVIHYTSHLKNNGVGNLTILDAEGNEVWCSKKPAPRTCPHAQCGGREFKKSEHLKNHLLVVHKEKQEGQQEFKCYTCFKTFPNRSYLRCHEWTHLSSEDKVARLKSRNENVEDKKCPVCSVIFLTKSKMNIHLNSKHSKIQTYLCEICGIGFTRKDALKEHCKSKRHLELAVPRSADNLLQKSINTSASSTSSSYSYPVEARTCNVCNKTFSNPSSMVGHRKTVHDKSTKVICELCGITLSSWQIYSRHMQKLHHEKPGSPPSTRTPIPPCQDISLQGRCETLESTYDPIDKPYECSFCGKRFKLEKSYQTHFHLKHDNERDLFRFPCPYPGCGKAYPMKSRLNQHMNRNHLVPETATKEVSHETITATAIASLFNPYQNQYLNTAENMMWQ